MIHNWVIKGGTCPAGSVSVSGIYNVVYIKYLYHATYRRASCPGGRFPPSFIHQVIIITSLNNFYRPIICSCPEVGLIDADMA